MNEMKKQNAEENAQFPQECDVALDEEVAEFSCMILERNKVAYQELAK